MASITVRDVPDEVRDELAARAASAGRSLQQYLRGELIELALRPSPEAFVERLQARKRATGTHLSDDAIVHYRDEERR
jgi:plasmid stability protein